MSEKSVERKGLSFARSHTREGVSPYSKVEFAKRDVAITNERGETIFEQKGCEFPKAWSQMAAQITASKYFRISNGDRETSLQEMFTRVVSRISEWGDARGYFATPLDRETFEDELTYLLLHQKMSFNSPVWFNLGVPGAIEQSSACFIQKVEDNMNSIMDLAKTEAILFKGGSGTGTNLSPLRSSKESLSGGGTSSGPVSFMKGYDAFAGAVKSGGTTRRAAKMAILNADHPDIEEFIWCKANEEKKAHALIDAGYDGSFTGEAYASISFQNANNSVRLSDAFMEAVSSNQDFELRAVQGGKVVKTIPARKIFREIAEAAWQCGDPGVQYDDIINSWHTVPNSGRINASNPCAEFLFLDDSACNLASINLLKFMDERGNFDVEDFREAVRITITAQEILVTDSKYPTEKIARNSEDFRPLGLGYSNLGALLMAEGVPYDSEAGREWAAAISAVMTGEAYCQSARIASQVGPFNGYSKNREAMLKVINRHREASYELLGKTVPKELVECARNTWDEAVELGVKHGFRNAQVVVIAPTGTISFMMDCDTTGIEPDIALVKYKKLVGGGLLKIVNQTVPAALEHLGYLPNKIEEIVSYINEHETIEGAPQLRVEDLPVFDCAFQPQKGERSISWRGHLKMLSAAQPFVSGSISKTINMPKDATVDDIEQAFQEGWQKGLKCLAVYRDSCKRSQPLETGLTRKDDQIKNKTLKPLRRRLPAERKAITHRFEVGGHEGYVTVGLYEDGTPGELFLRMAKEGSTISGLMDSFATAISLSLQYGVPLEALVNKFSHTRYEPQGFTKNPEIPIAKSLTDYIFRWLASKFLSKEARDQLGIIPQEDESTPFPELKMAEQRKEMASGITFYNQEDAPTCPECGGMTVRNGACYRCLNCGASLGCS